MKSKNKLFLTPIVICVGVFSGIFWSYSLTAIKAEEPIIQRDEVIIGIEQVTNEFGLSATPKVVRLAQNAAFPDVSNAIARETLFSQQAIPTNATVTYQYVDANGTPKKPTSSVVGFQRVYVKILENQNSSSIIVPIPVTVTDSASVQMFSNKVAFQMDNNNNRAVIYLDQVANKSANEINTAIVANSNARAWNVETGEAVPVGVATTTVTAASGLGTSYNTNFSVDFEGNSANTGSKATTIFGGLAKTTSVAQNATLSASSALFSSVQAVSSLSYSWVDEAGNSLSKFDTGTVGFHWAYIRLTDVNYPNVSTIVRVPINTTSVGTRAARSNNVINREFTSDVNSSIYLVRDRLTLISEDIRNISDSTALKQKITDLLGFKAWNKVTEQAYSVTITSTDITAMTMGAGTVTVSIQTETGPVSYVITILVVPSAVGDVKASVWQTIESGSTNHILTNPINKAQISFNRRGLTGDASASDISVKLVDGDGKPSTYRDNLAWRVPYVNNGLLYPVNEAWASNVDNSVENASSTFIKYYVATDKELKGLFFDKKNDILYVYRLSIERNLNFGIKIDMYNLSATRKSFSMLEVSDTDYLSDYVPIYSLGNGSGFYLNGSDTKKLAVKLKDSKGAFLSDYNRYFASSWVTFYADNYFLNDFSKTGQETNLGPEGTVLVSAVDSAYQVGAPPKSLAKGEALKVGYETFLGSELPLMVLKTNSDNINVYSDYRADFQLAYTLTNIPNVGDKGVTHATYPDGTTAEVPFTGDATNSFASSFRIPRTTIPVVSNPDLGTVKSYSANFMAEDLTNPFSGLVSNEKNININVYNMWASPVPQTIRKDSVWNKPAASLVSNIVAIPGHNINFQYVNAVQPVDTSKNGFQMIQIRMTDTNEPSQSKVIDVPALVTDNNIPASGIILGANDIEVTVSELSAVGASGINQFLLDRSKPVVWDVQTGLVEGATFTVTNTTLTNASPVGAYTATLRSIVAGVTVTKIIQINVVHDNVLLIESAPSMLDFGTEKISYSTIKSDKPSYDAALVVSDHRTTLTSWTLTATLESPLRNQQDSSKVIPDALRYKVSATNTVVLNSGAQAVTTHINATKGDYNISNEWASGNTGFQLEIPAGGVRKLGDYQATILWQLQQTP